MLKVPKKIEFGYVLLVKMVISSTLFNMYEFNYIEIHPISLILVGYRPKLKCDELC
jgi:hypothetical protein